MDEEKVKREIEELNLHYLKFGSERDGEVKKEQPAENVFQMEYKKDTF